MTNLSMAPETPGQGNDRTVALAVDWRFEGRAPKAAQGWKLYVSVTADRFSSILEAVRPVLDGHRVPYKFAADINVLRRLNAGICGYSQIGKSIVVYLDDDICGRTIVQDLKRVLGPYRGSNLKPPFTHPVGAGYPLSFRYGAFTGMHVSVGEREVFDERARRQDLSALPEIPFADELEAEEGDRAMNRFLLTYPIFEVLGQAGKGGVYAAFDIESPTFREVIVKVGRRHGNLLPDGRDGMDLVAHEHWFYVETQETELARHMPALVDYSEFPTAAALVMERLEGGTLLSLQIGDALRADHLTQVLKLLDLFHACGFVVGDAKLANFIETPDGKIKAIDFESAVPVTEPLERQRHASFLFTDEALLARPLLWEKLHFLYSVIHGTTDAVALESRRIIDLNAVLNPSLQLTPIGECARDLARELCESDSSLELVATPRR